MSSSFQSAPSTLTIEKEGLLEGSETDVVRRLPSSSTLTPVSICWEREGRDVKRKFGP